MHIGSNWWPDFKIGNSQLPNACIYDWKFDSYQATLIQPKSRTEYNYISRLERLFCRAESCETIFHHNNSYSTILRYDTILWLILNIVLCLMLRSIYQCLCYGFFVFLISNKYCFVLCLVGLLCSYRFQYVSCSVIKHHAST